MRRAVWVAAVGLGCVLFGAASIKAAPGNEQIEGPTSSYRWLMVEAAYRMSASGGGQGIVDLCERAKKAGYNGLLLWDSNLWDKQLPSSYMENARTLRKGLDKLGFTLVVQMCPRGAHNYRWSGDSSMVEPRPANPTSEERDYRYLCLAHPGVIPMWEEQIRRAEKIYEPDGWHLSYDELRVSGDDRRCRESGKTPGQLLAEHSKNTIEMVRRVTPGRIVSIWNDMFDPHHNAKPGAYYHVRQGFSGSWDGIDSDVLILNWNDSINSYDFWSKRGNKQVVAGYYDGEMGERKETEFLRQVRRRPGVVGYMYTTWEANFTALRPYLSLSGFGDKPIPVSKTDDKVLFLDKKEGRK